MTSSPLRVGATLEQELDYYKKQYEQLETDLADFQASSKELEEQLERDIETAEKNERKLKEKLEKLSFEVEEWKTKHKQAKAEANTAQNTLQKEVTTLRESHRAVQMKLRDIEVANDDYERQARNTESSLEDLESKYNVAIERSVLLEEEVKNGDQEREALRIETQRLRDELGDLKVESEITREKLRLADDTIDRLRSRKPSPLAVESLRARSPSSEVSGITPSSPTASTPPPKSDTMSEAPTPPSPPYSDAPPHAKGEFKTPLPAKRKSLIPDAAATPRPSAYSSRTMPRHTRGSSLASTSTTTSDARSMRPPPSTKPRPSTRPSIGLIETLPRADSLHQIKALRGRMQKIEERVHSARSKLPPHTRTPTGSPRTASTADPNMPSSVTLRRSVRRPSVNITSPPPSDITSPRRESHFNKRLSFGIPRPPSTAPFERPPSALDRPHSSLDRHATSTTAASATHSSRPSSRGSLASSSAAPPPFNSSAYARPVSRSGARTPSSMHSSQSPAAAGRSTISGRPRSSMGGGSYAALHGLAGGASGSVSGGGTVRTHRPSASVSELGRTFREREERGSTARPGTGTLGTSGSSGAMRRDTLDKARLGSTMGTARRQSGAVGSVSATMGRRTSMGVGSLQQHRDVGEAGEMRPPSRRKMSDVGETY